MTARMLCGRRGCDDRSMAVESEPTVQARRTPLSDLLIVDADVHVHESPGALAPYCDGPWDVALRNVADVPERYLDIPGFSPGGDGTLTGALPDLPRGGAHGPHARADGDELRRDPRRPRGPLPRPPAQARRCCPRPTTPPRSRAPTTPGSSISGPRATTRCSARIVACPHDPDDAAREIERYADDPSIVGGLPAVRGPRPAVGPPPLRPDLRRRAERRACPSCCTRVTVTLAGLPVQQPRLRHRVRPPRHEPHLRDHGQHRAAWSRPASSCASRS